MAARQNSCKAYRDKIIFFEDIGEAEQRETRKHTDTCPDCQKHLRQILTIKRSLNFHQKEHSVDEDLLRRYVLHLAFPGEPETATSKLSRTELASVERHVSECERCGTKLERLRQEFDEIEQYLEAKIPDELTIGKSVWSLGPASPAKLWQAVTRFLKEKLSLSKPGLYPATVGALAVITIAIWLSPFFRGNENPYFALASLEGEQVSLLTRGSTTAAFDDAAIAFRQGKFLQAISQLEDFVVSKPGDAALYYARYLLGIAYLKQAQNDFLGHFRNYDLASVNSGILNLEKSLTLDPDSEVAEDCHWYLAKAYLMKKRPDRALVLLEALMEMRGRRFKEAKALRQNIMSLSER